MFPYADDTKSYSIPGWIILLVALNVLFFLMSYVSGLEFYIKTLYGYGAIPARFFPSGGAITLDPEALSLVGKITLDQSEWIAPGLTLFTSMFLHGGIAHLIGNMWFLWLFGDNVEDRFGKLLFPIFYIVSGVVAGLVHIMLNADSTVPAIGASGAIAGVMGAYVYMFPRSTVATLFGWGLYWRTIHISAPLYLGGWFVLQMFGGFAGAGASNVAFWAHIGGFVAGLVMAFIFDKIRFITWWPGDRGYTGFKFSDRPQPVPIRDTSPNARPSAKRRYIWRD